jgi:hypothetical protein
MFYKINISLFMYGMVPATGTVKNTKRYLSFSKLGKEFPV